MHCDVCGDAAAHSCIGMPRCRAHCCVPQRHYPEPAKPPIPAVRVPMRVVPQGSWRLLPQSPRRALNIATEHGWPKVACTEACGPLIGRDGDLLEAECWSLVVHVAGGAHWRYVRGSWVLRSGKWKFDGALLRVPLTPLSGAAAMIDLLEEGPR